MSVYINQHTGTVPSSIGSIQELRSFTLHGNLITGTLPDEICEDKRTVDLNYRMNLMSDCHGRTFDCPCCTTCCNEQKLCCPNVTNSPWCQEYFCECFFYKS